MTDPARHQSRPVVLLRPLPARSPIHDLWAGTKLIAVLVFSALLSFWPGWAPIAIVGVLVIVCVRLAGVSRAALPTIPKWLWVVLALGAVFASLGAKPPMMHVGPVALGVGGLLSFARLTVLAIVLLGLCMLVSWTTNVADVAPAIATLGRPLKIFRIPVDDWATTTALALRSFPMLIDEFRVLHAARKLRPRPQLPSARARLRRFGFGLVDLLAAGITAALRRGDEMGDAVTARGGTGQISAAPARPKRQDWIALGIVAVVCTAAVLVELLVFKSTR